MSTQPARRLAVYQYPSRSPKPSAPRLTFPPKPEVVQPEAEPLGLIQGRTPDSREEWRMAVALSRWKLPFDYQVSIRGGATVRGGQVIDFVVYTPFNVPVQVFGGYWHKLDSEDLLGLAIIEQEFHRPAVVFWDRELTTQQAAYDVVRERLL